MVETERDEIKILIVDDSRIFRGHIEKCLIDEPSITVVGSVMNGVKAMEFIEEKDLPDVVTLDIEMPEMNGLETLAAIEAYNEKNSSKIKCLMISSFTRAGSDITIEALEMGAIDFVTKPDSDDLALNLRALKSNLLEKISYTISGKRSHFDELEILPKVPLPQVSQAILIGSSTGGPKALMKILPKICEKTNLPIMIAQHMPPTFTASLAESLNKKCNHEVKEAVNNEIISERCIYIAPGGNHLILKRQGDEVRTHITNQPPENGCRPSVDVLFRSAALVYKNNLTAIILTGMGNDGSHSLGALSRAGAYIIVQDEESSVVWGMPGAAVETGLVDEIVRLEKIPDVVSKLQ